MRKFYSFNFKQQLLLLIVAIICCIQSYAQPTIVFADPALGYVTITNLVGNSVNANELNLNSKYIVKLQVFNLDLSNGIPPNTAYVDVALGTKMVIDPTYNLSGAPLNNYFSFTYITGSNPKIRCNIINTIPADYSGLFEFRVIAGPQGNSSTVTGNFLISNANPSFVLSDVNQNNSADISYTVGPAAGPLPVNITNFTARNSECSIAVNWNVSQEINVANYEVQFSKDGASFVKVTSVNAGNKNSYNAIIPLTEQLKSPLLFIRLKSVDNDGTSKYSSIVTVKGNCLLTSKQLISCYPNPVTNESYITIAAKGENFNGIYMVSLLDAAGKSYVVRKVTLLNVATFKLDLIRFIAAGNYFIKLQREGDETTSTLQFIKE